MSWMALGSTLVHYFFNIFWPLLFAVNKMLKSFCGFYLKDYMMT